MSIEQAGYTVDASGVATLIIHGGPLNILGSAQARTIAATLRDVASNPAVRVLVIAGAGEKTFVGGADIREMAELDPPGARAFIAGLHDMCAAANDLPMPSIACIRGWCIGVGLELAASCDLRIAAEDAHFTMPEVRIGIPSVIQGAFLSRLVGEGRARWLMLTGRAIDAATALQWGLLNDVVPTASLSDEVAVLAMELGNLGAAGMRAQKRVLRSSEAPHLDSAMQHSMDLFAQPFETDEPARFMQAFLQRKKQPPA